MDKTIRCCGNCYYYEYYRDPISNRKHSNKQGSCNYNQGLPSTWAESYLQKGLPPQIFPRKMWGDEGENCAVFFQKAEVTKSKIRKLNF